MSHIRKQLRDAVITRLTGLTSTGANVFPGRIYPIGSDKMPGLLVYTNDEVSAPITSGNPRRYERTVTLEVQALVQVTDSYEDDLDEIAVEIEEAVADDLGWGGIAEDTRLVMTEKEFSAEAKISTARMTLKFEIDYQNLEGAPETAA